MIREYVKGEDYPMVKKWWEDRGWTPMPEQIFPPLGVIYQNKEGQDIAAVWLYMAVGVGVAFPEWWVVNPEAPKKQIPAAIHHLAAYLKRAATVLNYNVMFTTCKQPSFARLLEREGFATGDTGMIHLCNAWELK